MKNIASILLLILATAHCCTIVLQDFVRVADAPNYHVEGTGIVLNNILYLISGFGTKDLVPSDKVVAYDPISNTWTEKAPLPIPVSHTNSATDGVYIYIASGYLGKSPGTPVDHVWRYDPIGDTWTAMPPLPEARAAGALTYMDNKLHYLSGLGGRDPTGHPDGRGRDNTTNTHYTLDLQDPNAVWVTLSDKFPDPRAHFQAEAINQTIYAMGGQYRHDTAPFDLKSGWAYSVVEGTWNKTANMPVPRSHSESSMFIAKNTIIMIGGRDNTIPYDQVLSSIVQYDPTTNEWTTVGSLPHPLIGCSAGLLRQITINGVTGDFVIVAAGGYNYDIPTNQTFLAPVTFVNCTEDYVPSSTSGITSSTISGITSGSPETTSTTTGFDTTSVAIPENPSSTTSTTFQDENNCFQLDNS